MWTWARPRSWMRPTGPRNINHAGHSSKAVQRTEVRITTSLRKSVFVNEPCIGKNSGVTVHVIRRTELSISRTRRTTRDTVGVAAPGPTYCVAHRDGQRVGDKSQFVSLRPHRHIENLAASQSPPALHLIAVLIDNPDASKSALFSCRGSAAVVVGFSCREERHHSQDCQPTSPLRLSP